jgi:hypothetical protein
VIKASGQTGLGLPLLVLGLSGENVTRLAAGEPIRVRAAELDAMGLPAVEIVILYGQTENDLLRDLGVHGITVHMEPEH